MRRWCAAAAGVVLVLVTAQIMGCGSNGLPRSKDVTVTVMPSTATVLTGGTVTLTGAGSGFAPPPEVASPVVLWGIQESSNLVPVSVCGKLPEQKPNFVECPYGYVVQPDVTTFPSTAIYYAPPTPGTYHVVFTATQFVMYDSLQKSATAEITVTAAP